jgi:predicted membrane protein
VTIHHQSTESSSATSILDQLDITKSDLTDDQLQTGINLIQSFEDIFARDDINIDNTHGKHKIHLNDDRPFKQRYRRIPPAMFDEVKEQIRQL